MCNSDNSRFQFNSDSWITMLNSIPIPMSCFAAVEQSLKCYCCKRFLCILANFALGQSHPWFLSCWNHRLQDPTVRPAPKNMFLHDDTQIWKGNFSIHFWFCIDLYWVSECVEVIWNVNDKYASITLSWSSLICISLHRKSLISLPYGQ